MNPLTKAIQKTISREKRKAYLECATHLKAQAKVVNEDKARSFRGIAAHFEKWAKDLK